MKVKVILWGSHYDKYFDQTKRINEVATDHVVYYGKVMDEIIVYEIIKDEAVYMLYKSLMKSHDHHVILVTTRLSPEKKEVLEEIHHQYPKVRIAILSRHEQQIAGSSYFYIPSGDEIVSSDWPIFLLNEMGEDNDKEEGSVGETLIMGKVCTGDSMGQLVIQLLSKWQYVQHSKRIVLHLYGEGQWPIWDRSSLEEVLLDYTAEGGKVYVKWHQAAGASEIYYVLCAQNEK